MTLDDAIHRYLCHLTANGCSVHTIRSYRFDLRALSRVSKKCGNACQMSPVG